MLRNAKLFINNNWIYFTEENGIYDNVMSYLDHNNLSFVKTNYIDFNNVPFEYRGIGVSNNLSEYFSNNFNNNSLIIKFIYYHFEKLNFKYIDGGLFTWNIENSDNWMTSKVSVIYNQKILYTLMVDQTTSTIDNTYITSDMVEVYG